MDCRNFVQVFLRTGLLGSLLAATSATLAATDTWTGGGLDANWNTSGNWNVATGNAPPVANDSLVFDGTTNLTTSNNIVANTQFNGITFNSTAGAFTLGGNAITLGGDINDNNTTSLEKITLGLVLNGGTSNVNVASGGTLTFGALTFGNALGSTNVSTLNLNASTSATALTAQTNNASANALNITGSSVLTLNGNMIVGFATSITSPTPTTTLAVGGNELDVNGNITVGQNESGATTRTNNALDLSGLKTFKMISTGGTFGAAISTQANGTVTLANSGGATSSNLINALNISLGSTTSNAGTGTLNLGGGTNTLEATTFNVGTGKGTGIIQFSGGGGSVNITGLNGTGTANFLIGRDTSATSSSAISMLAFAGHNATVAAGSITLGAEAGNSGGTGIGNITFDTGTFNVVDLLMAIDSSGTSTNGSRGAFYLGGTSYNPSATGVLNVTNSLVLCNNTNATASGTTAGALVVNGGTGNIGSDITMAGTQGTRTTSLVLAGGTLNMQGHAIGSLAAPVTNIGLTLPGQTVTLSNLGGTGINGAGLTLASSNFTLPATVTPTPVNVNYGGGTLILAGTNTYTGDTAANSGTLLVNGTIANTASLGGGILGGTGTINGLVTVNSGALTSGNGASGVGGASGTLTLANGLTVNSGNLQFNFSSTSNNTINVSGGPVTFGGGGFSFILSGSPTAGTYTVLTSSTLFSAGGLNFAPTTIGRTTFSPVSFAGASTFLQVAVAGNPASLTWNSSQATANGGSGDGTTWDVQNNQNWTSSATVGNPNQYFDGDSVLFNDSNNFPTNSSAYTVTLSGSVKPGSVTFSNGPATGTYTLTGGGTIDGSTGLTVNGGGVVDVTALGSSSYSGNTTISGGSTLVVSTLASGGNNSSIGSAGTNVLIDGGTLKWVGGGNQTTNRGITVTPNGVTLEADPTGTGVGITISGPITMSGSGARTLTLAGNDTSLATQTITSVIADGTGGATSIVKNGSNSWLFSIANSYSGGTTINLGRIRVTNAGAFGGGSVTVASGGQAYLNAGSNFTNNFFIAGNGVTESGSTDQAGALRLGSNNAVASGMITLTGDARITARGANTNSTISGQITGNHNLELGNGGATTVDVITLSNVNNNWNGSTTISFGTVKLGSSSGASNGVIPHGSGAGDVTINGGNGGNATLDLNGFNGTINGLNSSGTTSQVFVTNNSTTAASSFTVGDNNASGSFGGVIQDGVSKAIGFTKIGGGTQTLSGVTTYTGATTVNGGTLTVLSSGSIANSASINVGAAGVLDVTDFTAGGGFNVGSIGTQTLVANGAVHGVVNLNSSATLAGAAPGSVDSVNLQGGNIHPGASSADGNVGTLNVGNLTVTGGDMRFDLAGASGDKVIIGASGLAAFNGGSTITIVPTSTLTTGNYVLVNLLNTGSTIGYSGGQPQLTATAIGRSTFHLDFSNANEIQLVATAVPIGNLFWTGANGNAWDVQSSSSTGTQNWVNANTAFAADTYFDGDNVTFDTAHNSSSTFAVSLSTTVFPGSVTFSSGAYTLSGGAISGTTGLIVSGGSLNLQMANSYTGNTTISGGATLQLSTSGALPSAANVVLGDGGSSSGLLDLNGQSVAINNLTVNGTGTTNTVGNSSVSTATVAVSGSVNIAGATLRITGNTTASLTGPVNGASGNLVVGDGTTSTNLTLSGSNSYSGATTINAGSTLKVSGTNFSSQLGDVGGVVNISSGGTLDIGGITTTNSANGFGAKQFNIAGNGVGGVGAIYNSGVNQQNVFQTIALSADASLGGNGTVGTSAGRFDMRGGTPVLDLAGHTLTKTGLSQFTLVGTSVLSTGGTPGAFVVSAGELAIETTSSVQPTTVSSITMNSNTRLEFFNNIAVPSTVTSPVIIAGTGVSIGAGDNVANTIASPITLQNDVTFVPIVTNAPSLTANNALTWTGNIGESGSHGVIKNGVNTLTLSGTNSYSGGTTISGGTLVMGSAAALGATTGSLSMSGGTLNLNGNSLTIGNLTGTGGAILSNTAGALTLTVGGTASPAAFAGNIQNGIATVSMVKNGTGMITLSGTGNTYTGTTTVNQGTLAIGVSNAIATTAQLQLAGGTLATGGTTQAMGSTTISLSANSTIDLGDSGGSADPVTFADSHAVSPAWTAGKFLRISHWNGNVTDATLGGGTDQVFVGVGGLNGTSSAGQLGAVHFTGYLTGSQILGTGELVPGSATQLIRGDVNQDGVVTIADVSALMATLTDITDYENGSLQFAGNFVRANHAIPFDYLDFADVADANHDGLVNNLDIQAEINGVANGGVLPGSPPSGGSLPGGIGGTVTPVPEPTSWLLLGLGAGILLVQRARRKFAVE